MRPDASDDVVAEVLGRDALGHSQGSIAKETGLSQQTVSNWLRLVDISPELRQSIDEYIQIAGDDLTAKWTKIAHMKADAIIDGSEEVSVQQAMVAYGISRDKTVASKSAGVTINAIMPTIILGNVTREPE